MRPACLVCQWPMTAQYQGQPQRPVLDVYWHCSGCDSRLPMRTQEQIVRLFRSGYSTAELAQWYGMVAVDAALRDALRHR